MEKKEIVFILSIFLITSLCCRVYAAVGVSPGMYEIDFEPNLEREFSFNFIFDEGVESELYVAGDLAEYVKLDKSSLVGGGRVTASLKLPSNIEIPGTHGILVGARQLSKKEVGVIIVGDVRGIINVKVPYPGKYIEIEFHTTNANVGNPVDLTVVVKNLGKESINAYALVEIYDSQEKYTETLNLGVKFVETKKSEEFFTQLDTNNYKAGNYKAKAIVNYDEKKAEAERIFKLGELYVGISNYTKEFEREKINKIDIEAESFWNDPIQNLYANIKIVNYSIDFFTPSVNLEPWSKTVLTGFFDTTPIKENEFKANITLHYEDKITSKIVELRLKKEINYVMYVIIAVVILIVVLIIAILLKRARSPARDIIRTKNVSRNRSARSSTRKK